MVGLKEGEEMASPAAEAIEALAQAKLSQHADLAGIRLDFRHGEERGIGNLGRKRPVRGGRRDPG